MTLDWNWVYYSIWGMLKNIIYFNNFIMLSLFIAVMCNTTCICLNIQIIKYTRTFNDMFGDWRIFLCHFDFLTIALKLILNKLWRRDIYTFVLISSHECKKKNMSITWKNTFFNVFLPLISLYENFKSKTDTND